MSYPLITLYTPGIKLDLARKADKYNPDAIIIDLEDTVPTDVKNKVRDEVVQLIPELANPPLVRINNDKDYLENDLRAIVTKNTRGILLPKAENTDNLKMVDAIEGRLPNLEAVLALTPESRARLGLQAIETQSKLCLLYTSDAADE